VECPDGETPTFFVPRNESFVPRNEKGLGFRFTGYTTIVEIYSGGTGMAREDEHGEVGCPDRHDQRLRPLDRRQEPTRVRTTKRTYNTFTGYITMRGIFYFTCKIPEAVTSRKCVLWASSRFPVQVGNWPDRGDEHGEVERPDPDSMYESTRIASD
jgi:hypothetical protein